MAIPVVTLLITSSLIGLQLFLTFQVIRRRRQSKVAIGTADSDELSRAVRAHGNFTEVTPIFLISLLILELVDSYLWWVAILGILFIAGRILHAWSILIAGCRDDADCHPTCDECDQRCGLGRLEFKLALPGAGRACNLSLEDVIRGR